MKKIFFFLLLSFSSFVAFSQTSYKALINKIESVKPNEYGTKRIDYGEWSTTTGQVNIWAGYDPRDSSYFICVNEVGKSHFKQYTQVEKKYKDDLSAKEKFEKILAALDPKKWYGTIALQ